MEEENIKERHKKEVKELQNKIQALKRSITKGDKKRKKDVNADIAKLQAELDQRHEQELHNATTCVESSSVVEDVTDLSSQTENLVVVDSEEKKDDKENHVQPQQKLSRAQKRRDKKASEEKARQKRLEEGEEESKNHARNIETKLFEELLKKEKLKLLEVQADGDCLYNAVSLQNQNHLNMNVELLRQQTSDVLLKHLSDYIMFTSDASGNMFTPEQYEKYCHEIKTTKAWGGQLELKAISQILKRPIRIYQANATPIQFGDEFDGQPVLLSYHRHQYGLGEHYNALLPDMT